MSLLKKTILVDKKTEMVKGSKDVQILREKVLTALKENGFKVNPHIRPRGTTKAHLKLVHRKSKEDKIHKHSKFLRENQKLAKEYTVDGSEIDPSEIKLELRQVTPNSIESKLFLWWNLAWWSIPFERPVGRQMRYILWDKGHDAPFGIIDYVDMGVQEKVKANYNNRKLVYNILANISNMIINKQIPELFKCNYYKHNKYCIHCSKLSEAN